VKLALQSFKDSYYYTNDERIRIPELKSYLQGDRVDQSPLAVKVPYPKRSISVSRAFKYILNKTK